MPRPPHEEQANHSAGPKDIVEARAQEVPDALMEDIIDSLQNISSGCDSESDEDPVRFADLWDTVSRSRVIHAPEVDYYEELLAALRRGDMLANLRTLSPFEASVGPHEDSEDSFGIDIPGMSYFRCTC